ALGTRTRGGARWLLWLHVMGAGEVAQERRSYALGPFDVEADEALVGVEMRARGGNCPYTTARVLRLPRADLDDPRRAGRQATLLAGPPRKDQPFEHWRTIAELGPLPVDRLLEALTAAEDDGQSAFG